MNAHCERFIGSIKRECLDRFLVFGENHLRHILSEYLDYYHHRRPHRGTGFLPPHFDEATREEVETLELGKLVRHEQLGGVLSWYEREGRVRGSGAVSRALAIAIYAKRARIPSSISPFFWGDFF